MLHFFKVTTFLWIILILHPGHTSLFLETVIIKFGGRGAEGREKQIPFSTIDPTIVSSYICHCKVFLSESLFGGSEAEACSSWRLRAAALIKKRLWHRCFRVSFAKILRTPFLNKEHLQKTSSVI